MSQCWQALEFPLNSSHRCYISYLLSLSGISCAVIAIFKLLVDVAVCILVNGPLDFLIYFPGQFKFQEM